MSQGHFSKMMLRTVFLALALAGCVAPLAPDAPSPEGGCDLKVEFASIGTGIDGDVLQKVDALLAGDKGVAGIARERWGREGEITLCVDTKTDADASRLFGQIKPLFPVGKEKPLRVETRAGERYEAPTNLP